MCILFHLLCMHKTEIKSNTMTLATKSQYNRRERYHKLVSEKDPIFKQI